MNLNELKPGDPVRVGNSPLKMFYIGPMRNTAFVQVENELGRSFSAATSMLAPWVEPTTDYHGNHCVSFELKPLEPVHI